MQKPSGSTRAKEKKRIEKEEKSRKYKIRGTRGENNYGR